MSTTEPDGALPETRARLLQAARAHLRKTRQNRNVELRLLACLREVQQPKNGAKGNTAPLLAN